MASTPINNTTRRAIPAPLRLERAEGLERFLTTEWLLCSRSGTFAMGTALGAPTRRYHSMCNVALSPPVNRFNTIPLVVDTLELDGESHDLSGALFEGLDNPHPACFEQLDAFEQDVDRVRWFYRIGDRTLTRTLTLDDDGVGAVLNWRLDMPAQGAQLKITPLVALRDIHALCTDEHLRAITHQVHSGGVLIRCESCSVDLLSSRGSYTHTPATWDNLRYPVDQDRGFPHVESLYTPGTLALDLSTGECSLALRVPDAPPPPPAPSRPERVEGMIDSVDMPSLPADVREPVARLCAAADQFVVQRQTSEGWRPTIPAGYPWFADWGRDTMIALPGLLLETGRLDEARSLLTLYAEHIRDGLVPNRFDDRTDTAHYNTADASLWFVHAVGQLHERESRLPASLIEACSSIIEAHRSAASPHIAMDNDALLVVGDERTQLTWMDAQHDGHCFTPRHGKPVEINALWINALRTLAALTPSTQDDLRALADRATGSFREQFWLPERGWLADVVREQDGRWAAVEELRPNQLIAISLPAQLLTDVQQRSVVRHVRERLYTPVGIRTLDPEDPRYVRHYRGTPAQRDASYHMGTAWPWLMGPFIEAHLRAHEFSQTARAGALDMLCPLLGALAEGGLGQIAEVYDGEAREDGAQHRGGCPAQAWSVAEVLRATLLCARKSR
jgi:predicted glycogen debranching enzyme